MRLLDLAEEPCLQVTSLDVLMITQTAIYMGVLGPSVSAFFIITPVYFEQRL